MRNNISKLALTAALMLAITLTFSCSGDSGGGNGDQSNISSGTEASVESSSSKGMDKFSSSSEAEDNSSSSVTATGNSSSSSRNSSSSKGNEVVGSVKKDQISGVSQKGPFVKGSTATLYELDDKLVQTGRSFRDIIADDKGSFDIKINVELASPYAMLEADGYYRNEVTGKISTGTIKLYAIADIREKSNVNVNILTHLEYYRVQKLVEAGKSLKEAKKQAQKEILAVFGITGEFKDSDNMSIFGTTDADAALLAISVLLQGDLTEGQFTGRLADFNLGFRETGVWDNKAEKKVMADWAAMTDKDIVIYCMYDNSPNNCHPMPTNDMCRSGILVKNCNESGSVINDPNFDTRPVLTKIKSNILGWNLSSSVPDFEKYVYIYWSSYYDLGTCDAKKVGEIKNGPSGKKYICKDNAWVVASEYESDVGGLGNCSTAGEIKKGNVSNEKYACKNNVWKVASYIEIKCFESKSCLTFTDTRDKQSYVYIKIGEQTWMAENLNYDTKTTGSVCYDNKPANCNLYGRLYNWETAMKACPDGWHLPSGDEWQELVDFAGGKGKLNATNGWNIGGNGTDDYGFSALPGGCNTSDFYNVGYAGYWWWSSEDSSGNTYYDINDVNSGRLKDKSYRFSVRCLQD